MDDFDWVTARSRCSLERAFRILSAVIDSNVKAANALKRPNVHFEISTQAKDKLLIIREDDILPRKNVRHIVFELFPDKITVFEVKTAAMSQEALFSAIPDLNDEGECRLEVDGRSLKLWQVSKKALENLFFGP